MEPVSLMILNDDCLLHLLECFELPELVQILGVCARLDALIAKFRHKYVNFHFRVFPDNCSLDVVRETLAFLGAIIKTIRITGGRKWHGSGLMVFVWIGIFCPNLESFVLDGFGCCSNLFDGNNLLPLMSNLKEFTLLGGNSYNFDRCFELATKLEGLTICYSFNERTMQILDKVSNLKDLKLVGFYPDFDEFNQNDLEEVLRTHLTLKVFHLSWSDCPFLNNTLVNFIANNLTDLEELSIIAFDTFTLTPFGDLPKLKKLTVEVASFSDFDSLLEKLAEKNIIEELHIVPYSNFDQNLIENIDLKFIGKLTNLKEISLIQIDKMTNINFKHLQNLTKLEKLSLISSDTLSPNGLLELVRVNQKLKWLDVRYVPLDYNFLEKLIRVLKQSSERQKFVINVKYTEIYKDTEKLRKILEGNSNLIKVLFLEYYDEDNYLLLPDLR